MSDFAIDLNEKAKQGKIDLSSGVRRRSIA